MAKVEVKPHGAITEIFVDDKRVPNIKSYSIHQEVGMEVPVIEVTLNGHENEYTFSNADIRIQSQGELQQSASVVRSELLQNGDWYNALVASIYGYLKEIDGSIPHNEMAKELADRLVGVEPCDDDIEALDLSVCAYNCLKRAGVNTVLNKRVFA